MSVLVTGGAGYIGSVTTEALRAEGEFVVVLDDLSNGHREAVAPEVPFYKGDVGDASLLGDVIVKHRVTQAIHFAAQSLLGAAKTVLETEKHPILLKDEVCSPGGTTITAVCELEAQGFRNAIIKAATVCMEKSAYLSK